MNNPKTTIEALLEAEKTIDGIKIYPVTLARYGLLELVQSPFVVSNVLFTIMNLIPSLYIMAQPVEVLKKYSLRNIDDLYADSTEWSEQLNPARIEQAVKEIEEKIKTMATVTPEISEKAGEQHIGKKAATAG